MMDKKPHIKPYLYGMFAGFGAISLSILFFFLIYRFQGFGNAVSTLTGILMPFYLRQCHCLSAQAGVQLA